MSKKCNLLFLSLFFPSPSSADQTLFQRLYTDLLSSTGKSLHEDGDNESAEEEPLECVRVVDNNSSHFTSDETPTPTTTSPAGEEIGRTGQQQNQTQGLRYLPGCSRTGRVLRDVSGCFDLAFLLDGSGSITREQFRDLELEFVRNVTNFFRLGKEKTHVSILIFTDNTRWVLRDEHDDRVLHRTLDNLTQPTRGDTNLRRALARFIQRVALPLHNGSLAYRESCRKVRQHEKILKGGGGALPTGKHEVMSISFSHFFFQKEYFFMFGNLHPKRPYERC